GSLRLLHGSRRRLGARPLPACIRTRVYPSSVIISGRSRIYPTSAERVGVRGALGTLWLPLTRRAPRRSRCVRIGVLSAKNAGGRPAMLSPQAGRGDGVRGADSGYTRDRRLPQQAQPQILRHVRVLILVDQDVSEPRLILAQHLALLAEQADAFEQEIAEVGGVEHLQPLLVGGIELLAAAAGKARGFAGGNLVGGEPAVLPAVDEAGEHARGPALLVDVLRFQQLLEQADLIVLVEDGEVGLQTDQLGVAAENFHPDRMERAQPWHALHDQPGQ